MLSHLKITGGPRYVREIDAKKITLAFNEFAYVKYQGCLKIRDRFLKKAFF
jgi:hypothetical protein